MPFQPTHSPAVATPLRVGSSGTGCATRSGNCYPAGTSEVWIGDVGWNDWEEINVITNPVAAPVKNFGWPCYEGNGHQSAYESAGLAICQNLYSQPGSVTPPLYTYSHSSQVVPGESCPLGSSSITGIAFEF